MDKHKNRNDLREAGKKRLEIYRSERSKVGISKTATSLPKRVPGRESHPGESTEKKHISNPTTLLEAFPEPVQIEHKVYEGDVGSCRSEVSQALGSPEKDLKIGNSDVSKIVRNPYLRADISESDGIFLEGDKIEMTHSQKDTEISHFQRPLGMRNSNDHTQVESTVEVHKVLCEGQELQEFHEVDECIHSAHLQEVDFLDQDKPVTDIYQLKEVMLQPCQELQSLALDDTVQPSYVGSQVTSKDSLPSCIEVEELKRQVDKVMKEKDQLLLEVECCKKEHQQSIKDRERLVDELERSHSQVEEMAKESAACKMQLEHKLAEERSQVMQDLKDFKQQLQNISSTKEFYGEYGSTVLEGEFDFLYLKHQLEGEIRLVAIAFREISDQLQVSNVEKAGLLAELDHVRLGLEAKSKEKVELLEEVEENSKYLQNLMTENGQLTAQFISSEEQMEELRETETHLKLELSHSQRNLERALSDAGTFASQLGDFQLHQRRVNDDKAEADGRFEEKHQEFLKARSDYEELAGVLAKHKEKMIRREEEMQMELAHLQSMIQVSEFEKVGLATKVEECTQLYGKMEDLEAQLVDMKRYISEINIERVQLADELDQDKMQLALVVNERNNLLSDLERSKGESQRLGEQLNALIDDNMQEVSKMAEEKQAFQEQLCDLKCQLTELADKNIQLITELDGHVQQSGRLGEDNAKLSERLKEAHDELEKLREGFLNSLEDSKKQEKRAGEHEAELILELSEIHQQIQSFSKEKEELLANLNNQAEVVRESEKHKLVLENGLREQRSLVCELEQEKFIQSSELALYKQRAKCSEEEKSELIHELQEARNQLQDFQEDKCKLSVEANELKQKITTMQMQLEQQAKETTRQLHEVGEENSQISKLLGGCKEELQKIRGERNKLEDQCTEAKDQLHKVRGENVVLTGELNALQQQVNSLVEQDALLTKEIEEGKFIFETKLVALEEQFLETNKEKDSLCKQFETLMQQVKLLLEEKSQVVTELEENRQCLQACEEELVKLHDEVKSNQQMLQESESINVQLKIDLEASSLHIQALLENNIKLVLELESSKVQLEMASDENTETLQELENLKHIYLEAEKGKLQLQNDLERLRHQYQEAEEKRVFLICDLDAMQQKLNSLEDQLQVFQGLVRNLVPADARLEENRTEELCSVAVTRQHVIELVSENKSEKAELLATIQNLQQQIIEREASHANKVSVWKARVNAAESTSSKYEKALREMLSADRFIGSTNHMASGVSKLIKVFEARVHTKDSESTSSISEQSRHQGTVETLELVPQRGLKTDDETLSQTDQLRQVEEERACLAGALRQVEIELDSLKQHREEFEKGMASLVEKNDQLVEQVVRDAAAIESLENQVSELQEKAKEVAIFQEKVEDLKREANEQAVSLQAERTTYMVALIRLANKIETAVQSTTLDSTSDSGPALELPGADICADDLTKKLEAVYKQSDGWHSGVSQRVAAKQQELDAVFELLDQIRMKLHQFLQPKQSATTEDSQLVECLRDQAARECGDSEEIGEFGKSHADLGGLREECNNLVNELQRSLEENIELQAIVRELKTMLLGKDRDIQTFTVKFDEFTKKYDSLYFQAERDIKEKLDIQDELHLVQKRSAEQAELYANLCSNVSALATKVLDVIGYNMQDHVTDCRSGDSIGCFDFFVTTLIEKYESALRDLEDLKKVVVLKDAETSQLHGQVHELTMELATTSKDRASLKLNLEESLEELARISRDREGLKSEFMQTEQKLSVTREKLSLAVTKGKGLVQQRDTLKQSLAEKNAELERLMYTHEQELQLKAAALHEAGLKLRSFAESGDRIEALQSELAYIRNSANILRESFLQKDAALQKLEELLEDVNLPDELHHKEIVEKIDWLVGIYNVQNLTKETAQKQSERISESFSVQLEESRDQADALVVESAQQKQEIEDLSKKFEELLRKYRSLAEQSAMLEQSLLERNCLIQRWEEVLDNLDMPSGLRSKEPEDKIEWLGKMLTETQNLANQLQNEVHASQVALESLTHNFDESRDQVNVQLAELFTKKEEAEKLAIDLQHMTRKYEMLSEQLEKVSCDRESLEAEVSVLQRMVTELEASQERKISDQSSDLYSVLVISRNIIAEALQEIELKSISSEGPASTDLEIFARMLVDKFKASIDELEKLRKRLTVLEKEKESYTKLEQQNLQSLQDALTLKDLETSDLMRKLEEATSSMASQEVEISGLLQQATRSTEELTTLKAESEKLQLERTQAEQRLTSTREKLSMAVKKGKNVVQQRDAMKQTLEDKIHELDHVNQELQARDATLQETQQRLLQLEGVMEHIEKLKFELSSSREYAASMEQSFQETNTVIQKLVGSLDKLTPGDSWSRDPIEKIEWIFETLKDVEKRAGSFEQEARKSKKAAELLALELEEAHRKMDTLKDETMNAEKKISILMEEKEEVEAVKTETTLHLEHAMANLNSLVVEVSTLRESKTESERKISSLGDILTVKMEELRHEQLKADQQQSVMVEIHADYCNLREEQTDLLVKVAEDISRKTQDIRRVEALANSLASRIDVLQDFGTDSASRFDSDNAYMEQALSVRSAVTWDGFAWETATKMRNTESCEHDDLTASLRRQCKEMTESLKYFKESFGNAANAFAQGSATIPNLLVQTSKGCELIAQKLERLQRNVSSMADFVTIRQEKEREVSELQSTVKYLAVTANSAIQELELMKVRLMSSGQNKVITNNEVGWPNMISDSEKLQSFGQEQFEGLKEYAIDISRKLLSKISELSISEQHTASRRDEELTRTKLQRSEKEKECDELRSSLTKTQTVLYNVISQQESYKSKINELENVIAKAESDSLTLQQRLHGCQGHEVALKRMKDELDSLLTKNKEQEGLVKALYGAEIKAETFSNKVDELEKMMREKCALVESLETSRAKALNRLSATVSKLDGLQKLSEGLLLEVENLHRVLESRDLEISQLRQNVVNAENEVLTLQAELDGKSSDMLQLKKRLQEMILGFSIQSRETVLATSEDLKESELQHLIEILDARRISLLADVEGLQTQVERNYSLLQDMRLRFQEQFGKLNALQEVLHDKQAQIERLSTQADTSNTVDMIVPSNEIEELGQRGKRMVPLNPAAPHLINARKQAAIDHLALEVDIDPGKLSLDTDFDKGHVFKTLTSSRFVPKTMRLLADRLDGFWVAGGRVLMRQPEARLGLFMYWFALHVWMVQLLL